jgi:hypothetical protein
MVKPRRRTGTAKVLVEVASSRLTLANVVPLWYMKLAPSFVAELDLGTHKTPYYRVFSRLDR